MVEVNTITAMQSTVPYSPYLIHTSGSGNAFYYEVAGRKYVIYTHSLNMPFDLREEETGRQITGKEARDLLHKLGFTREHILANLPIGSDVTIDDVCKRLGL